MFILPEADYYRVRSKLNEVDFNTYFAEAVLDGNASGIVYVDDFNFPQVIYIVHSYGMSLLFGDYTNIEFNQWLKCLWLSPNFECDEYLQVYPAQWESTLATLLEDKLVGCESGAEYIEQAKVLQHVRVNFIFNPERYNLYLISIDWLQYNVREFGYYEFEQFHGSVVPGLFWRNEEVFAKYAKAYAIYRDQKIAAVSFTSCRNQRVLELGIETNQKFRGEGLAKIVCAKLIDYALEHDLEPVWACRKGNLGSYNLALSLGFEVARELAYYQIKKSVIK